MNDERQNSVQRRRSSLLSPGGKSRAELDDEPLAKEYGYALGTEWGDTSAGHPLFFENHPRGRGLVRLQPITTI